MSNQSRQAIRRVPIQGNGRCTRSCSFHPLRFKPEHADSVMAAFAEPGSEDTIAARVNALDPTYRVSGAAAGRHRLNHIEPIPTEELEALSGPPPTMDQMLQAFVEKGFRDLKYSKQRIGPGDFLRGLQIQADRGAPTVLDEFLMAMEADGAFDGPEDSEIPQESDHA